MEQLSLTFKKNSLIVSVWCFSYSNIQSGASWLALLASEPDSMHGRPIHNQLSFTLNLGLLDLVVFLAWHTAYDESINSFVNVNTSVDVTLIKIRAGSSSIKLMAIRVLYSIVSHDI